jgi:hypothetical protein
MLPDALRLKLRTAIRQPGNREKMIGLLRGVSKQDLQNPAKVRGLVEKLGQALGIRLSVVELSVLTNHFVSMRIDPHNPLHLMKLWSMF